MALAPLLARSLAAQAGVALQGKVVRRADGSRTREYRLTLESVELIEQDSAHHFDGLTDPGGEREQRAQSEKAQALTDELMATLMAA